jgi:hypothetical protein
MINRGCRLLKELELDGERAYYLTGGWDFSRLFWKYDLTVEPKGAPEVLLYFPNLLQWLLGECNGDKRIMEIKLDKLLASVKAQFMATVDNATKEAPADSAARE